MDEETAFSSITVVAGIITKSLSQSQIFNEREETPISPISVATVIKGRSRWWRGGYYFITPYAFDILVTGSIWRFPNVNHCVGPKPRMVSNILTNITSESHLLIGKGECCLLSFQRGLFRKAVFTPRLLILDKILVNSLFENLGLVPTLV